MRFIVRMQGTWKVHVQFGAIICPQEYFSFRQHGGPTPALRAAKKRRDALVLSLKVPKREYTGNGWYAKPKENNFSGVAGISLAVTRPRTPYEQLNWSCYYMVDGEQKRITRAIKSHGYRGAWKKVTDARRAHTGQDIPLEPPPPPDWVVAWATARGLDLTAVCTS